VGVDAIAQTAVPAGRHPLAAILAVGVGPLMSLFAERAVRVVKSAGQVIGADIEEEEFGSCVIVAMIHLS
jgi:hypothetical protein